jgi:hypothetical protein
MPSMSTSRTRSKTNVPQVRARFLGANLGFWRLRGRVWRPQFASNECGQKWGSELRFEVNGQIFFVNFVPEEGRWYCFAPTSTGVQRIPVSMDATPFQAFVVAMDEQAKESVN